jgi:hypothetical protein
MRFGIRIGPFWVSQRLGRTQAQKRAAAKARAAQAQQRQEHREWLADPAPRTVIARLWP